MYFGIVIPRHNVGAYYKLERTQTTSEGRTGRHSEVILVFLELGEINSYDPIS